MQEGKENKDVERIDASPNTHTRVPYNALLRNPPPFLTLKSCSESQRERDEQPTEKGESRRKQEKERERDRQKRGWGQRKRERLVHVFLSPFGSSISENFGPRPPYRGMGKEEREGRKHGGCGGT